MDNNIRFLTEFDISGLNIKIYYDPYHKENIGDIIAIEQYDILQINPAIIELKQKIIAYKIPKAIITGKSQLDENDIKSYNFYFENRNLNVIFVLNLNIHFMKNVQTKNNPTIKNSIRIINKAIKTNQSVSATAINEGFGKNYVYDVKRRLNDRLKSKVITKDEAKMFRETYRKYENA